MSKGGRHPTARRRVVAIFVLAVMLPSFFLSYVGLKSIKQEKLWQQQLVEENLRSFLTLAVSRVESNIEEQSRAFLNSLSLQKSPDTNDFFSSLHLAIAQQTFVEQVFLVDNDLRLIYPRTFRDQGNYFWRQKPKTYHRLEEPLAAGESLELRGSLEEAINEYQKALTPALPPEIRLALLSRIARCQFKKNEFWDAEQTYRKIITEDRQRFYGEEIPYILTAYYQLVKIAEGPDSRISLPKLLLDFYQILLENFQRVERSQYEFYLDGIKARLSERAGKMGASESTRYEQLRKLEGVALKERSDATFLQHELLPAIRGELSLVAAAKNIRYFTRTTDGVEWSVGLRGLEKGKSPVKIVGFKIHAAALMNLAQKACDQVRVGEGIRVEVVKDGNERFGGLADAKVVMSAPLTTLADLIPGYAVGIVASGEDPVKAIARSSMTVYYVLIFSIIAIIILGVVLIFRDISREEELSRMKSEFIANVSHEIKTPIATVRTLAEVLKEGWVVGEEKRREYFHLITRESDRLSHLVENILDFSRIDAQRKTYRIEKVSPYAVIKKSVERFRLLVDGQGVTIKERIAPDLPPTKMDAEAIEQAILNLLDNAVKYSGEEKLVDVSAEVKGGQLIVKLSDHGCGIEKKDLQRIFEKFYRVESRDGRKVVGSGIGLTLVKEIIEAHAGKIEVESEVGKGSTFTIVIPIAS